VNANPYKARMAKAARKRPRDPGDLRQLTRVLWQAILEAEEILTRAVDDELTLRAVHAISQAAGQYARLLEVGEFEARLPQIEDNQQRRNGH
jgi:hypothetical protein